MKRFLMILALGGIIISGCGDDDGDDDDGPNDGGGDSGLRDAGPVDSGMDAARDTGTAQPDTGTPGAKINNPGTLCTTATASTCTGSSPTCATTVGFGAAPPGGGFCTSSCTSASQCGATGACPFGELFGLGAAVQTAFLDAGVPVAAQTAAQQCLLKCTSIGGSGCPTGWSCTTLKTLIPSLMGQAEMFAPAVNTPVCLPAGGITPTVPDAGVVVDGGPRDSGVVDASGMDARTGT